MLDNGENRPVAFAKIRNSNTTFVEQGCKNLYINQGVYIDIFPLDGYPDRKVSQKIAILKKKLFDIRMSKVFFNQNLQFELKLLGTVLSIVYPSYRKMLKKADAYYKKFKFTRYKNVINYFGVHGAKEAMPKEVFGEGVYHQFEDIMIKVPDKVDEHLTRIYGDYMKLPPEEKRYGHHHIFALDLERSYIDVLKNNK